jgi:hypothetical protein
LVSTVLLACKVGVVETKFPSWSCVVIISQA